MDTVQLIESYFNAQNIEISVTTFYIDLLLAAVLAFILSRIYIKFGTSLSDRKVFSNNFVPLALTTVLIISIIKTSLALSLGLVGALSIVRFRAAIKEPEELTYLFLTIALGLGFGANQRYVTVLAFVFIAIILIVRNILNRTSTEQNLYLNLTSNNSKEVNLDKVVNALKGSCSMVSLKRVDKNTDGIEALLFVKVDNLKKLNTTIDSLESLDSNIKISFLEDRGVFA